MNEKPITFDDLAKLAKELADKAQTHHDDTWQDHYLRHVLRPGQLFPHPDSNIHHPDMPSKNILNRFRWNVAAPLDFRHFVLSTPTDERTPEDFEKAVKNPVILNCDPEDLKKVMRFMRMQNIRRGWHYNPEKPKTRGWISHAQQEFSGRIIHLNPYSADIFTVLHEIGHTLCGPCCCQGHEEWIVYHFVITMHAHLELNTPVPDELRIYRDTFLLEQMMCERGMGIEMALVSDDD